MSQEQPTVNVTIKLLNEVLNYLASRPYTESAGLISRVHAETLPQVQPPKPTLAPVENATQEKSA